MLVEFKISYSEDELLEAARFLQDAGEEGLLPDEVIRGCGSDWHENGGFITHCLRLHGFLVQANERRIAILPNAPIINGNWVRHPKLGVVKVLFERPGFDYIKIGLLGQTHDRGGWVRVHRSELRGQ